MTQLIFLWDNFGPMHADRCNAVAEAFAGRAEVTGIEIFARSSEYDWHPETGPGFRKITVFSTGQTPGFRARLRALWAVRRRIGRGRRHWFLCHYERPEVFALACLLRLGGARVFTMGCSKFDDKPRSAWREAFKSLALRPYHGAIGSGRRGRAYFCYLGLPDSRIAGEYNTLSLARIRRLAGAPPAPGGRPHAARHFTIVARFVAKKNLLMALRAYAIYAAGTPKPRALHLCGGGPLDAALRAEAAALGIGAHTVFHGFLQSDAVARLLADSLALILPSTEEQFGNVVIEAQAMGVPVILTPTCGAADLLVRAGVSGELVEPDNPQGLAAAMARLGADEAIWRSMAEAAHHAAPGGDVARFVEAVARLTGAGDG